MGYIKKLVVELRRKSANINRKWRQRKQILNFAQSLRKTEQAIIILGTVEYANLGDQAICLSEREFLERYATVFEIRDTLFRARRELLKDIIRTNDILVIPGGGNMGDFWPKDEERRRWIIQDYPNNKIIVFPQTICYTDTKKGKNDLRVSQDVYNEHKHLVLCAREKISYQIMKDVYPRCNVLFVPDIVLALERTFINIERNGVLVCMRNDIEKRIDDNSIQELLKQLSARNVQCYCTDTVFSGNVEEIDRDKTVTEKIREFANTAVVLTDRLHGMIFAAITGTTCIVLPNNNHKIEGVYRAWLQDCEWIHFEEKYDEKTILDMLVMYEQTKKENRPIDVSSCFDKLVEEINKL